MLFSMLLLRTPLGIEAESKKGYQQSIRNEAKARYTDEPLESNNLYARIVWFARKKGGPDVDNIFKRILDALEGIVYAADRQIRQCLATRIDIGEGKEYTLSDRHIPEDLYEKLVNLLDSWDSDILFIEVGQLTSQEVVFGKIDRSGI
jgi:endodeoxyribonuclease RusA